MFDRLTRPLTRGKEALVAKVSGFVNPIKNAFLDLRGKLPSVKAMAGSESAENENSETHPPQKQGLIARLKNFKHSLNEMNDFQKLILLVIAICLPAGILIATLLMKFFKNRKK